MLTKAGTFTDCVPGIAKFAHSFAIFAREYEFIRFFPGNEALQQLVYLLGISPGGHRRSWLFWVETNCPIGEIKVVDA